MLFQGIYDGVKWSGFNFTVTCNNIGSGKRLVLLDGLPHNNAPRLALPCTRGESPAFVFQNESPHSIGVVLILRGRDGPPTNVIYMGSTDPRLWILRDVLVCPARTGIQVVNSFRLPHDANTLFLAKEWTVQEDRSAVFIRYNGDYFTVLDIYVGHIAEIVGFTRPPIHLMSIALVSQRGISDLIQSTDPELLVSVNGAHTPHDFLQLPFDPLGKNGGRTTNKRLH